MRLLKRRQSQAEGAASAEAVRQRNGYSAADTAGSKLASCK